MSWTLYRWVWRLEAPLFLGMPPSGSLNRCRLYVPACNLWGALTAELAQRRAEACGRRLAGGVTVENPVDHDRPGEEAEPLGREIGSARAEGRQAPAHRGQVVVDTLDENGLAPSDGALVAKHRPLARQGEVLRSPGIVVEGPTDQPETLAAAELGNDDPPGEMLAQEIGVVAPSGSLEQAEVLGDPEPRAPPQVGFELVTVGVAQRALADDPVGNPRARTEARASGVRQSARW